MTRESTNMHLVNYGLRRGPLQWSVAFPIIGLRINHYALHCLGSIVLFPGGGLSAVASWNNHCAAIRVEQYFRWIKARTGLWIESALNPITINLSRLEARHEHVPVVISTVGGGIDSNYSRRTCIIHTIE